MDRHRDDETAPHPGLPARRDFFVGVAVGTCVGANVIREESGLVAVTMLGIYLANQRNLELEPVIEFKEHLQVLLVGVLFIMLAGRVTPSQILDILSAGLIFVALLVLVIRPASVLLGLVGTETTRQERTLMSFMAPRGIVAASVASIFCHAVQ
ncbi:transporter [Cutibacterium acnes JCM 18909]|nr:transporter [Cutibacterium acnes JCM 18909]